MSAETMRRAAAKIRERADAAAGSPWRHVLVEDEAGSADSYVIALTGYTSIGEDVGEEMTAEDAEHIASWDPTAARAVAELLEAGAEEIDRRVARDGDRVLERANATFDAMCELARTYLGEDA